ncbi:MAG: hypothetical protein JXR78_14100 [Victivallales bacterium]|nr:hypothetical protein [Victivallales bacterium]
MSTSSYLYHGSTRKIKGKILLPSQADDLAKRPENLHCAVYATDVKEIAIAMAIISCKGVMSSSLIFKQEPFGIIYEGWPKQKYVYLYTLPKREFEKTTANEKQWISYKPVQPIKVQKLLVADYLHLVREATMRERDVFFKKYGKLLHPA